ncbi:MAG: hypothetical protein IT373_06600, partial [Polyangiaceae bacterium]|nr:hypothetical protein [Polyangiaceae bacterium]
ATRDLAAAEVALERAVELHATGGRVPGRLRGEARLLLARVLVEGGKPEQRARAASLTAAAAVDFESAGASREAALAELHAFAAEAHLPGAAPR